MVDEEGMRKRLFYVPLLPSEWIKYNVATRKKSVIDGCNDDQFVREMEANGNMVSLNASWGQFDGSEKIREVVKELIKECK